MAVITTFPSREQWRKAQALLGARALTCEVVSPDPGYAKVGAPALVMDTDARAALADGGGDPIVCAGFVDYRPAGTAVPAEPPRGFEEDVFAGAAVVVLAPCVADPTKIRLIAHTSGDTAKVFPYMNAEMREASYNAKGPTFTFMDQYRMISMYPQRIAVAKADDIVDGWRTLEMIRCRVNDTWARRAAIAPSDEMRQKPPALEIFNRLPGTNCRACGEATCLAFAVRLWNGGGSPEECSPVLTGEFGHLRAALLEICAGLGVSASDSVGGGSA
jgi:ArsR family metal-binding transcriptional regulator